MSDEVVSWWQDVVDDLDDDTTTVTITMSRVMVERTLQAVTEDTDIDLTSGRPDPYAGDET